MKKATIIPPQMLRYMAKADRPSGKAGMTTAEGQAKYAKGEEKKLQTHCANLLRMRGLTFRQMPYGRKTPWPGWPDFVVLLPDRAAFVECKAGDEIQSCEQLRFQTEINADIRHNHYYIVVRSVEALQEYLNNYINLK